jgi:hypothetical protein
VPGLRDGPGERGFDRAALGPGEYEIAWLADGDEGELCRYVEPSRPRVAVTGDGAIARPRIEVPDDLLERLDGTPRFVPTPALDPWRATPERRRSYLRKIGAR